MRWSLILVAYGSLFALGITANIRGPLFPAVLIDLHLSDTYGSLFFSVVSIAGAVGAALSSLVLPRKSLLIRMQFAFVILVLGLVGTSLSASFSNLLFFSALYGFSSGIIGVWQNVLVKQGADRRFLRQALAGLHSMYALSSLAAPLLVAMSISFQRPWRSVFMLMAIVPLVLIGITALAGQVESTVEIEKKENNTVKKPLCAQLNYAWFGAALAACSACEVMVSTWLALYINRKGGSAVASITYVALFFAFLLIGRGTFTLARVSLSDRKVLLLSALLTPASLLLGLYVHPFFLSMVGLFVAPFFPVAMNYAVDAFGQDAEIAISWAVSLMSVFIVLTHSIVGYLSDCFGMPIALHTGLVLMAFVAISLILREKLFCEKKPLRVFS